MRGSSPQEQASTRPFPEVATEGYARLVERFDEISELWRLGAETAVLGQRLEVFLNLAIAQFDQEMRLLEGLKDDVLLAKCARHEEMVRKIEDVLDDFRHGSGAAHWHDMRRAVDRALRRQDAELSGPDLAEAAQDGASQPLIVWPGSLALGIDWIDRQHRAMIETINKIGALPQPYDPDDADTLLEQLRRIAWHHFHEEEAHLGELSPESLPQHVGQHRRLLSELDFLIFDIRARRIDLRLVLAKDLCPWLEDHIRASDRADFQSLCR